VGRGEEREKKQEKSRRREGNNYGYGSERLEKKRRVSA
jgi:hypothetical protein